MARTKNTKKVLKGMKFSPYRGNRGQTSPETDSAPPSSPPASLFVPGTSVVQAATGGALKDNEKKQMKDIKLQKKKKVKKVNQRMAATGGIDLAELDTKDPEMASAVRLMVEQEEKDEEELKKGSKTGLKLINK